MLDLFSLWGRVWVIVYSCVEDVFLSLFLNKCVSCNMCLFFLSKASPRCANLALKHYLLKPVQRIPQYQLLLTGTSAKEYFSQNYRNNFCFFIDIVCVRQSHVSLLHRGHGLLNFARPVMSHYKHHAALWCPEK